MPIWKVMLVALLGASCFALFLGTLVVPLALDGDPNRWFWFAGLFLSAIGMTTLLTLYLRNEDKNFMKGNRKGGL